MRRMLWAACKAIGTGPPNDTMIDVTIRFDDPSAVSDHALGRGILHAMETHDVCATLAMIPCTDVQHSTSYAQRHPEATFPSGFSKLDPAVLTEKNTGGQTMLAIKAAYRLHNKLLTHFWKRARRTFA